MKKESRGKVAGNKWASEYPVLAVTVIFCK
jgi:hypothetical protein